MPRFGNCFSVCRIFLNPLLRKKAFVRSDILFAGFNQVIDFLLQFTGELCYNSQNGFKHILF
ncbi:hypothetical protein OBV_19490 [Oscillibacter valericigenes Sjm18-20]|nr:hypothetical protein OBV_19490 [Oscillibacter valericigenes Sjm18-20]